MNTFQTMPIHFSGSRYRNNELLSKNPLQLSADLLKTITSVATAGKNGLKETRLFQYDQLR